MKLLAFGLLLAIAMPAHAAGSRVVLAAPGSGHAEMFATPVVPMRLGESLTIHNADLFLHSVVSDAIGPDDSLWCGPRNPGPEGPGNPRRYPIGECPLFWSDLALPRGRSSPVLGTHALLPGRAYGFSCSAFESMTGVLLT